MAKIQLNGKKITIKAKYSIFDLLRQYKLDKRKIKKKYLKNNDKLEIVHFIGGG